MREFEFEKKDRNTMIGSTLVGLILDVYLIRGALYISMLGVSLYIFHKNINKIKNTQNYDEYEFLDKEKYEKGIKRIILIFDIYVVVRIISILVIKNSIINILELVLVTQLLSYSGRYSCEKYVKTIDGKETKKKKVFIKNKLLTLAVFIVFIGVTAIFFNIIKENESKDFIKFGKYEYSLTYDKDNKRTVKLKFSTGDIEAKETDENSKYFDDFITKSKEIINNNISTRYSFIASIFMVGLSLTQMNLVGKKDERVSIIGNVFLIGIIIFGMFTFDERLIYREDNLREYYGNYLIND